MEYSKNWFSKVQIDGRPNEDKTKKNEESKNCRKYLGKSNVLWMVWPWKIWEMVDDNARKMVRFTLHSGIDMNEDGKTI